MKVTLCSEEIRSFLEIDFKVKFSFIMIIITGGYAMPAQLHSMEGYWDQQAGTYVDKLVDQSQCVGKKAEEPCTEHEDKIVDQD